MYRYTNYIPGTGDKLTFDPGTGFAINPDGQSSICFTADHRNQLIGIVGTGTVTVYGSMQKAPVDFSAPSTIDNLYAVIVLADYSLASSNYVTSLSVTGSTKIAELNTNLLTWIGIHRSGNGVEVKLTQTTNL